MTVVRRTDNYFDNTRMTTAGYEIVAVETYHWDDSHSETEILWAKEEPPVDAREVPF